MENLIDNKLALTAFERITRLGEKTDTGYQFQGVSAWQDYDGYTCFLGYNDVTMTLMFHGKYDIEYSTSDSLKQFMKKINLICAD
ncbi:DUF3081 domain-containing protein [Thalassotalea sp. HSM 43]|uniref:DUF3081 domain-containing protein n=1 Tax=Thalassotalea sp. HSM 43 TaxID=2552945 RepID=UPI0010809B40|nr:DUF3081 domain-containing protein [Thalassotalea sp. HSM 43]QBY04808.1 DUF3081 domain-containing protein [Thalassotalea sp. HSM 43]